MSDYSQSGNRYTAIFIRDEKAGTFMRAPFDLVRFNVDEHPDAERAIVPRKDDDGLIFEKIWVVDQLPWGKKVSFHGVS